MLSRADAILAGWVHPGVVVEEERARHVGDFRRMLLAGLVLLFLLPLLLLPAFTPMVALAGGAACAALPLIAASVLSGTGSRAAAGATSLGLAAVAVAWLAAASGGLFSPLASWAGLLPLGAVVSGRSWRWFAAGLAAAAAACGLAAAAALPAAPGEPALFAAGLPLGLAAAYLLAELSVSVERRNARRAGPSSAPAGNTAVPLSRLPGLVTLHDLKGDVLEAHGVEACRDWLHRPIGRGFFRQIHVADRLAFMQAIDAIRQGAPHGAVELRMHAPHAEAGRDGMVAIETDLSALPAPDGTLRILAQSRTVAARTAALAALEERAGTAERENAAKTRFLTAVTHELRTPLNAILGFSEVLAGEHFGGFESDKQREYVGLIRQSGDHLLSLVNSMLDVGRIAAGRYDLELETFGLGEAVGRCESMLALQAAQKGVCLTTRVARDCGELTADRRAIDQILINLVANAIKFTEKGGVVTVDAERRRDRLRLSVSDTGIGIAAEHLETIGQPFMRVEAARAGEGEGTGLGLALVKGLVALHGGTFTIASRPGEGTVVRIELAADGSGAGGAKDASDEATMIEFPPRLPAEQGLETKSGAEGTHDAQARTA